MADLRRFLFIASLLLLAGIALRRVIGFKADPITLFAVMAAGQAIWRGRRERLEAIRHAAMQLRHLTAEERSAAVAAIESEELRAHVAAAVAREGSETRDGSMERFPLPAAFRARAASKFWRAWALAAVALAIAAFLPELASRWRAAWLGLGVLLAVRARRKNYLSVVAASQIEITPFRLSYLTPNGVPQTISFADGVRLEDVPHDAMMVARSGDKAIPISYHLIGLTRLTELLNTYGAVMTDVAPRRHLRAGSPSHGQ